MRNWLAFLAALVLTAAGAGWYLGWYQIHLSTPYGGHQKVTIDLNTDKVTDDVEKGKEEVLHHGKDKLQNLIEKKTDTQKSPLSALEEAEPPR